MEIFSSGELDYIEAGEDGVVPGCSTKYIYLITKLIFKMSICYYVYMLHESPIQQPYFCKIGITNDPVRRLAQLQAGNPRALRSWDYQRRPTDPFGLKLPNKEHAETVEKIILNEVEAWGCRLHQDCNYEKNTAGPREWVEGIPPERLYKLMVDVYFNYIKKNGLLENVRKYK